MVPRSTVGPWLQEPDESPFELKYTIAGQTCNRVIGHCLCRWDVAEPERLGVFGCPDIR